MAHSPSDELFNSQSVWAQAREIWDDKTNLDTINVLHGISHINLLDGVKQFAEQKGLTGILPLLKTGALVAQDPTMDRDRIEQLKRTEADVYGSIHTLTEEEMTALRNERVQVWHHKKEIPRTIILCSIAAAVQGWDQTGSNGANITFPNALGIPTSNTTVTAGAHGPTFMKPTSNDWTVGLINAAPYLSAGLIGCWLSDPLNFYFGRRGCIFLAAIFCTLPIIGSAFSQTWPQLLLCRLLLGIGMGAKATTVPIYMAENSPKSIRGALVMTWQMCVALGIFLGFSANLVVSHMKNAWRYQFGSAFIPAIPLLVGVFFCPESPRWYIKKDRYLDAFNSLKRLRNTELQAARDLYYIYKQLTDDLADQSADAAASPTNFKTPHKRFNIRQTPQGINGYFVRLKELFTKNRVRQATLASLTVMIAQQMCGSKSRPSIPGTSTAANVPQVNIIAFFSSTIFKQTRAFSDAQILWCSWGFGLVNFVFAFPALFTIDRWGRRKLLLLTFPQLSWTLLAAGLCSHFISTTSKAYLGCVTFFVFLFAAFYATGEGPVPFTYSAEVFPLSHRELGMGLAVAANLTFAAVLSVTFPAMLVVFQPVGAFSFYAVLNIIAFVMIFFLVPETRERSLEDLDYIFERPIREFTRKPAYHPASHQHADDHFIQAAPVSPLSSTPQGDHMA
ncbi:MAG: hypothetical protein M1813_009144 [Trichoglossum hirsutum]|nr:MAG: hypothetical protein M1813_009144 [Trichoglossum hirsutum]